MQVSKSAFTGALARQFCVRSLSSSAPLPIGLRSSSCAGSISSVSCIRSIVKAPQQLLLPSTALKRVLSTKTNTSPATYIQTRTMASSASNIPAKMKAILIEEQGGPEVIQLKEIDTPKAGPGEVLIKTEYAG